MDERWPSSYTVLRQPGAPGRMVGRVRPRGALRLTAGRTALRAYAASAVHGPAATMLVAAVFGMVVQPLGPLPGSGGNGQLYGWPLTPNALAVLLFEVPTTGVTGRWQWRTALGMVPPASVGAVP
ncbi:hypothetical protein ACFVT2_16925 [Streptomyces sp. NPDC058000]|uniref:hypothetical protein n=1 Tax=Streptomyces sp. NPDC058000 TaxID=3346299 RepID=UPI0036ED158C